MDSGEVLHLFLLQTSSIAEILTAANMIAMAGELSDLS